MSCRNIIVDRECLAALIRELLCQQQQNNIGYNIYYNSGGNIGRNVFFYLRDSSTTLSVQNASRLIPTNTILKNVCIGFNRPQPFSAPIITVNIFRNDLLAFTFTYNTSVQNNSFNTLINFNKYDLIAVQVSLSFPLPVNCQIYLTLSFS